jgi:hypothetical protein
MIDTDTVIGEEIGDDELTALALAADPDMVLDDDAVSILGEPAPGLLPGWYMPAATSRRRSGWRTSVVALVTAGFLFVAASGFCITYGILQVV